MQRETQGRTERERNMKISCRHKRRFDEEVYKKLEQKDY